MNKATRWKRRILRDHRGKNAPCVHPIKLFDLTEPGDKFSASIWGYRSCARCVKLKSFQGIIPLPPILDEVPTATGHVRWSDLRRELYPDQAASD